MFLQQMLCCIFWCCVFLSFVILIKNSESYVENDTRLQMSLQCVLKAILMNISHRNIIIKRIKIKIHMLIEITIFELF